MSDKCQVYELERRALAKARCSKGWKMPVTPPSLFAPLLLQPPHVSLPAFLSAALPSSSVFLTTSVLHFTSDCPCQCFLLYFHLTRFCRAYQGLLTAPAVRYLSPVYLSETFSHHCGGHTANWLIWPGPGSFDVSPLLALSFEGIPWPKKKKKSVWPASNSLLRSLCVCSTQAWPSGPGAEPKPDRQEAFKIRWTSRKARCGVHAQSQGRLGFIAPHGGTHSHTCQSSHSSHVSFTW